MFDADALIKLNRAGVLGATVGSFSCLVPGEVFEEAVTRGRDLGYIDSEAIALALSGVEVTTSTGASGDDAILRLAPAASDLVVVSDDRSLLNRLVSAGVFCFTPNDIVIALGRCSFAGRGLRNP